MNLRAKFVCEAITIIESAGEKVENVRMSAVTSSSSKENAVWSKWTPSGYFTMSISNPRAQGILVECAEYYIDLTRVEHA